jgi:hypothetical protein
MKKIIIISALLFSSIALNAQYSYESSNEFPFGKPNPNAPEQIRDFQPLIGICDCKSYTANQDGSWADPVNMTWEWKYIMNGMAVQDMTLKMDGGHSGSIRQYNTENNTWYVHYYSTSGVPNPLPVWEGGKVNNDIILFKKQKAPNGFEGFYKIIFSDISTNGFNWLGTWVDKKENGTISFPLWKIECAKQK